MDRLTVVNRDLGIMALASIAAQLWGINPRVALDIADRMLVVGEPVPRWQSMVAKMQREVIVYQGTPDND